MLFILTGNGKGKTTSALGTALRAAGWNKKTAIVFFDKGGSHYGEQKILSLLKKKIDIFRFGCPRFDERSQTFRFENLPEDQDEAERGMKKVQELFKKNYFLIVCDELISCLHRGLLSTATVRRLIDDCPHATHLLLTGRSAPGWLLEKADLASEIKEISHYYPKTKMAIKGLDY